MSSDLGRIVHLTKCLTMQVTKIWQQPTFHGATKLRVWTWASVAFSKVEKLGCGKTLYSKMSNLNSAIPWDRQGMCISAIWECEIPILCQGKMPEFPSLVVRLNPSIHATFETGMLSLRIAPPSATPAVVCHRPVVGLNPSSVKPLDMGVQQCRYGRGAYNSPQ